MREYINALKTLLYPPPPDLVVLSWEGASGVTQATSKVFTIVNCKTQMGRICAKLFAVIVMMRR